MEAGGNGQSQMCIGRRWVDQTEKRLIGTGVKSRLKETLHTRNGALSKKLD